MSVLSFNEIETIIHGLLQKYQAECALLFGSYARGEATPESDLDVIIIGGSKFVASDIFALAEDLREISGKDADVFEIRELNTDTSFYNAIMKEAIQIN